MGPRRRLATIGVLASLTLVGCDAADPSVNPVAPGPEAEVRRYVALGDSYTAAPYVGTTRIDDGCFRSVQNYPRLLAEAQGIDDVTDVSCSGATTADVTGRQRALVGDGRLPPQLAAVTPETDLVTIGIGGNDGELFASLARGCPLTTPERGFVSTAGACGRVDVEAALGTIEQTGRNLDRVLRRVHTRAPDASVVLVGYPRLVGSGGCAPTLPVAKADAADLNRVTRALRDAMRAAALRNDALFLDLYAASRGHDVCSDSPWVNGVAGERGRGMPLHPLASGQQAVARLLGQLLFDS